MSYQFIQAEFDNNIAIVRMNRPPLNALNGQLYHELLSMIDEFEASNEITGIVITGRGDKAFVYGNALISTQQLSPIGIHEINTISRAALSRIERVSKPIVAAINGLALDSGLELAMACNYCICTEHARFAFPELDETKPSVNRTKRMQNVLMKDSAKELMKKRDVFGPEYALELQIVDEIVTEKQLLSVAKDWASKLRLKDVI